MALIVTGIGFLIHVYSAGYMHDDARFPRFFAFLNFFILMMLTLVLANNYLLLYVGWEGVGLASYLLIGFWFEKPSAADAGKKAFLVNRIGDFGLAIAIMFIWTTLGTLQFSEVFATAPQAWAGTAIATTVTLLLLLAATGKSAEIPLYVWLPDAMEGPTPVSALIHAATMVTAGVYMLARSAVLLGLAPTTSTWVAVIGVATALFAATIALTQTDLKRILAYSTVSQLGFMFLAVGVGAYSAGHLPPADARLLQGALVPGVRQRDARAARRARHSQDGQPAQEAAGDLLDLPDRRGRVGGHPAPFRVLQQG